MRDLSADLCNLPGAKYDYDWAPIHLPGSIQDYGVLLVADPKTRRVQFVSNNARDMLGIAPAEILDKSYVTLVDHERERKVLNEKISPNTILFPNPIRMTVKGREYDAVFHAQGSTHQIEIEPVGETSVDYDRMSLGAAAELYDPPSVEELYQRAVRTIREVSGFDRVMLYRFDARNNGQVIAEATRNDIGSFLGMFFPSGDISARARQLYLSNFTRYIPDIGARTSGLSPDFPGSGSAGGDHPVDMSFTNLRSVAPCHITYLKNIGVRASMSFSINVDDKLWGLFACHHYQPRNVSYNQRVVCEQTAMMFIYRLVVMSSTAARFAARQQGLVTLSRNITVGSALRARLSGLRSGWHASDDAMAASGMLTRAIEAVDAECGYLLSGDGSGTSPRSGELTASQRLLLDLVEADSAAIVRYGKVIRIGDAPHEMAIYAIASMFGRELPDLQGAGPHVYATDCLSIKVPVAGAVKDKAAGILAAALSLNSPAYLIWFRREQIQHATWAGNPSADAMSAGAEGSNPRASFEAWKQDIRDLSRPWMIEDVRIADELAATLREMDAQEEPRGAGPSVSLLPAAMTASSNQAASSPHSGRRVIRIGQR